MLSHAYFLYSADLERRFLRFRRSPSAAKPGPRYAAGGNGQPLRRRRLQSRQNEGNELSAASRQIRFAPFAPPSPLLQKTMTGPLQNTTDPAECPKCGGVKRGLRPVKSRAVAAVKAAPPGDVWHPGLLRFCSEVPPFPAQLIAFPRPAPAHGCGPRR